MTDYLVLWDIDHTLIETGGVGRQVFADAFEIATGRSLEHMPDAAGQTEPELFNLALEHHGIQPTAELFRTFAKAQARGYIERTDELRERGRVLPGVREVLATLTERRDVHSTVLTGNTRLASRIKLAAFDLDSLLDLEIGAYGDDLPNRPELVPLAQERASEKHGSHFSKANTVLIGDTTRDIEAARKGGARVIAVATGSEDFPTLANEEPDGLFDNLSDNRSIIEAITARQG